MESASDWRLPLQRLTLAGLEWKNDTPAGAPVVCVHGWLDNAASFAVLGPLIAQDRHVTSIDLPGHGYSDRRPPGYGYHLLDYVQDLADLLERMPQPVHVIGHSLGGILLSLLASIQPEKLLSITMIDSLGPYVARPEDFPGRLKKGIDKALARERGADAQARKAMPIYGTPEEAEKARQAGVLPLSPGASQALVPRNLHAVEGGWSWRTDSRLRNPSLSALTEQQVLAALEAIAVPVLLLQAEKGMLASDKRLRNRSAAIADLTHKVVPGSHHCHLDGEVPGLSRIVDEFMQRSDPTEPSPPSVDSGHENNVDCHDSP